MPVKWYEGEITDIRQLSPEVRQFTLKVQSEEQFRFLPGQFITMDLPVGEKRLDRWRSYSIANAPDFSGILEFCIVKMEGGLATSYLFDKIIIGDIIRFKGPDGGFVLPSDLNKEIVMICTGTGVAPFRSMLQHIIREGLTFKKIHLIFGTRYSNGVLYKDEFEQMAKQHQNFIYSVALSREDSVNCHHGYVHPIYMKEYEEKKEDVLFMICGWSRMIDEAVENLIIRLGYNKSQVRYELYG
jgi:CDP-4-dehydro-6-deoxyglucose reductase